MAVSKRMRFMVLERDGFTCHYCKASDVPLEVDHVIPKSLGGQDIPANLVAACVDCNRGKAANPVDLDRKSIVSAMRELRPLKRAQLKAPLSTVIEPRLAKPNRDEANKYYRAFGGIVGSGKSVTEALKYLIEKSPSDVDRILEAHNRFKAKMALADASA